MKRPSKQRRPGRISRPKVPLRPWITPGRDPFSKQIAKTCRSFAHSLAQFCYHVSLEPEHARKFRQLLQTDLPRQDDQFNVGRSKSWLAMAIECSSWADGFQIRPTSHADGKAAQAQRRMRRAVDSLRETVSDMQRAITRREAMARLGNAKLARKLEQQRRF